MITKCFSIFPPPFPTNSKVFDNCLLAVENLALGKPATQSDVLWSYKPGLAVDGDPNTCSFTSREESPRWWQVRTKLMVVVKTLAVV